MFRKQRHIKTRMLLQKVFIQEQGKTAEILDHGMSDSVTIKQTSHCVLWHSFFIRICLIKGQLISEGNFGIFDSSKKQTKIFQFLP